jgi:hypothetical protein
MFGVLIETGGCVARLEVGAVAVRRDTVAERQRRRIGLWVVDIERAIVECCEHRELGDGLYQVTALSRDGVRGRVVYEHPADGRVDVLRVVSVKPC